MKPDYKYKPAQCDVPAERRAELESYRTHRTRWLAWLDTDQHHAIWTTLSDMVWTDVSFRNLSELAANHGKSGEKTCLHNPLIGEQLVMGHIAREVLGIRRLMDETRGVISLLRLVTDIRGRWKLFTRENCICHDGLPYDYEAVMREEMTARAGKGAFWGATTGPQAWSTSQMAHEQFDRLAGIDPGKRTREDRLPASLLDTIEAWLDASGADAIVAYSHDYLAHAGGPDRRKKIEDGLVTADRISETIRNSCARD